MDDQWFYGQDGSQRGPVDLEGLRALASAGQLRPHDLVWRQGMGDWEPASKILPELFVSAAPPQPAPPQPQSPPRTEPIEAPPVAPPYQPSFQQHPQQPLGYQPVAYDPTNQNGRAVAALVLGICSLPTCFCPFIGIVLGVVAIILGAGVKGGPNKGLAVAGLICGIVGVVLGLPQTGSFLFRF